LILNAMTAQGLTEFTCPKTAPIKGCNHGFFAQKFNTKMLTYAQNWLCPAPSTGQALILQVNL